MARFTRIAIVGCALALATGADATEATEAASATEAKATRLPLLSSALLHVKDRYLDPQRVEPKQMVVAALTALARAVPELLVAGDAAAPALTLRMGADAHDVDLAPVTKIWDVRPALVDALDFVRPRTSMGAVELERIAVNGVLSTLDLHTVLLPGEARTQETLSRPPEKQVNAGVGLVLGYRAHRVTVVKVLRGSPAERVGLERGDLLLDVDGRSTGGVDLQEIVGRLQGPPGSTVSVSVVRGAAPPRTITVRRKLVAIPTVEATRLPDGIAYVRLSELHGRTHRELRDALRQQAGDAQLRGVILDLRDNPGGLFDAAIRVVDSFLEEGTILEAEGLARAGEGRRGEEASADPGDVLVPVVVLVNQWSASASEIVAAALRDNGRAVLLGQRTFGMGTVQQLLTLDDELGDALKLTTAQLRTPGGFAFDRVGLEPDVITRPGRATRERVQLFAPRPRTFPASDDAAPADVKPLGTFTYLADEARPPEANGARAELDEELGSELDGALEGEPTPERALQDRAIAFAAQVLARAETPDRAGLLAAAARLLPELQAAEDARIAERLGSLGVDWTHLATAERPTVNVTASPPPATASAGAPIPWTVTVENRGAAPISRLRAWTVAPGATFLDGRELVFGTIPAGGKRSVTLSLTLADGELTPRRVEVTLRFEEGNGHPPPDATVRFELRKVLRPRLAVRVQLACAAAKCARLGAAPMALHADVTNAGPGAAPAESVVKLEPDERLYVTAASDRLGSVPAGGRRRATLRFRVPEGGGDAPVRLRVVAFTEQERTACALEVKPGAPLPPARACPVPVLRLSPDPDAGVTVASGERFRLEGAAESGSPSDPVRRVLVFVGERKVVAQLAAAEAPSLAFSAELPLEPGENVVLVQAETRGGDLVSRWLRVYR